MYAVTTQDRCATPPRSPTIRGSAVLTMRLSSMASKMAISRPGKMIITWRGGRNAPPAAGALVTAPVPPDAGPPGPFPPGSVAAWSMGSATPGSFITPPLPVRSGSVSLGRVSLTYRPASHYAKGVTYRPSSKNDGPGSASRWETNMHDTAATPRTDSRSRFQKVAFGRCAGHGYEM